jgi:hypothetical protein
MTAQRVMQGVLGNFLATFTSRHSEYDGYWLFGFLVDELTELRVDLLASPTGEQRGAREVAVTTAIATFDDQVRKAGLDRSQIREASLSITRGAEATGSVNGQPARGYTVHLRAAVVMSGGQGHDRDQALFVAPHDPAAEARSARLP